jgi:tropomyosin, fungi type
MASLRLESDGLRVKLDGAEGRLKELEQQILQKDQEITSLTHRNAVLEAESEKAEKAVAALKHEAEAGAQHGTQNEALQRRLQLFEEEAEEADKNLRETNDKYVHFSL